MSKKIQRLINKKNILKLYLLFRKYLKLLFLLKYFYYPEINFNIN
jgi:hypothetical protein